MHFNLVFWPLKKVLKSAENCTRILDTLKSNIQEWRFAKLVDECRVLDPHDPDLMKEAEALQAEFKLIKSSYEMAHGIRIAA